MYYNKLMLPMKRQEIEQKIYSLRDEMLGRIKSTPVISFFVGILIGVFLASFQKIIVPMVIVILLALGALWLFADNSSN